MKKFLYIWLTLLIASSSLPAASETSSSTQSQQEATSPSTLSTPSTNPDEPVFPMEELIKEPLKQNDRFFTEFLNMLATLGFIIALILIVAWFLKRLVNSRLEQANSSSSIKVLERRSLSPKSIVYLLEIEGTGILIAESVNGITRLSEFPVSTETSGPSGSPENTPNFSKILESKK